MDAGVGADPDGEIAGVAEGGGKDGDFAGDAMGFAGDCGGETAGDGDLLGVGAVVVDDDLGEGAGALSARTKTEEVTNRPIMKIKSEVFIFSTRK